MNKDRLFLLLTVFFSLVNCTLLASIDMKCDLCGKDIKVEGQHINKYFSDPNLSFEKDINLIYPMIFSFPTLVKCPHCYYISVPSEISNQANKEKIQNYINTHPELKEDLSNKPWMQYEHAAEMSILNSDPSIITARCYLLAAWVSNKEKPLDRFQIDELTKLIPTNILSSFLENPPITDFNHGPSNIDWAKSIIKIENKLKEAKLNDSELAVIYLALGNIYFTSNNISKAENYFNKFLNTDTVRNIIQTHENLKNLRNDLLSKVERSRKYDELAKKYFTLSLKESHVLKKGITSCNYILGELDRSLGNFDNAEKYYQEVINESDIDKKILENINFVFNNFLKKESKELNKKQALKEEQNIKEIFQNINNDPMKLLSASETLKNSNRRDLIFPKLKEFIKSGNDDLIEAAVYSMSDHTQEAVDLQVSLLKSGKCINAVLTNLRFSSDLIKKSDDNVFINIFNKDATPRWNITSYLAALDTENCRKAIIDKANKMFSKDELLALSKYDGENTALSGAHTAVLNALALIQSRESIMTLLKTLTAVKDIKSDSRMITNIKSSIGYAVEITFNRPFGFTRTTSNRPYGKYPLVIEDKTFEQAYTEFVNWYQQIYSSGKTIAQIITEGFKPLGYNIEPIDSIDALNELITGLTDSFNPVRINCYKELVKRTGIMHRACNNYEEIGFNNDYTKTYYSDWLKENKEKLKFDKNKHKFIISK